jgi:hypothetical protein
MPRKPKHEAEVMALLESELADASHSSEEPVHPDVAAFQARWGAYQSSSDAQVESEAEPLISSAKDGK